MVRETQITDNPTEFAHGKVDPHEAGAKSGGGNSRASNDDDEETTSSGNSGGSKKGGKCLVSAYLC